MRDLPGGVSGPEAYGLIDSIRRVEWDDPASVQFFIQEQEEERLKEVDLGLSALSS